MPPPGPSRLGPVAPPVRRGRGSTCPPGRPRGQLTRVGPRPARRVAACGASALPPSASLCAPVGTPGPGGSLGTSLCSASFKFTRPAKASEETLKEKSRLAVGPPGNGGTPSDGGFPRAGRWHPVHHGARRCDISAGTRPSSSASLPNLLIDSARNATWLRPDPWACFQVAPCPSPG